MRGLHFKLNMRPIPARIKTLEVRPANNNPRLLVRSAKRLQPLQLHYRLAKNFAGLNLRISVIRGHQILRSQNGPGESVQPVGSLIQSGSLKRKAGSGSMAAASVENIAHAFHPLEKVEIRNAAGRPDRKSVV